MLKQKFLNIRLTAEEKETIRRQAKQVRRSITKYILHLVAQDTGKK